MRSSTPCMLALLQLTLQHVERSSIWWCPPACRYFNYVREEMLKDFDRDTDNDAFPIAMPRLVRRSSLQAVLPCVLRISALGHEVELVSTF